MATISAANVQALCDSVAKHIIDAAALIGSTSAIQSGQATTLGKIAALNDPAQEYALLDGFENAVNAETAWLTQESAYNTILDLWFNAIVALENATGGLGAFLTTNGLQVDPHFLDAYNRAVLRGAPTPNKALPAADAFGSAVANMGQFNATGAGAGAFVAGSSVPSTYGNAPLQAFNAGAGATGASAGTYTVTYNAYSAGGVLQTGLTTTVTVPGNTAAGGSVSVGVSGVAVTGLALSGGNNGDKVAIRSTLLRAVSY